MIVQIDVNELAAEITRKIREEMASQKITSFGEVMTVTAITNGHKVTVKIAGAETPTVPLTCLTTYAPTVGDWVMLVHPQNAAPVVIGKCPV